MEISDLKAFDQSTEGKEQDGQSEGSGNVAGLAKAAEDGRLPETETWNTGDQRNDESANFRQRGSKRSFGHEDHAPRQPKIESN